MMNSKEVSVFDLVPTSSANVQGVIAGALSPIKTSRNDTRTKYFNTQFSDDNQTVRFVSFEPKLWSQINDARANSTAVSLKKLLCQEGYTKRSRSSCYQPYIHPLFSQKN